jgi:hypothetical protein
VPSRDKGAAPDLRELQTAVGYIYDDYRTALLNRKYYAKRLATISKCNAIYEGILSLGASGSIAAWSLWRTGAGEHVWAIFAGFVAVLVVLKPFFRLTHKVEQLTKLHTGYGDLHFDLDRVVREINRTKRLSKECIAAADEALSRFKRLAHEAEVNPSSRLLGALQQQVNAEVPVTSL